MQIEQGLPGVRYEGGRYYSHYVHFSCNEREVREVMEELGLSLQQALELLGVSRQPVLQTHMVLKRLDLGGR